MSIVRDKDFGYTVEVKWKTIKVQERVYRMAKVLAGHKGIGINALILDLLTDECVRMGVSLDLKGTHVKVK